MTDRELLELAAKAAGYRPVEHISALRLTLDPPVTSLWLHDGSTAWNPIKNNGDALRLAVDLGLIVDIDIDNNRTHLRTSNAARGDWATTPHNGDPYAATRRAIVLCAAKIGEEMS